MKRQQPLHVPDDLEPKPGAAPADEADRIHRLCGWMLHELSSRLSVYEMKDLITIRDKTRWNMRLSPSLTLKLNMLISKHTVKKEKS